MPAHRKKPAGMTAVQAVVMQELENIVGKKNGPASVGALPDHGSTIPGEETAMNKPNDATRPVDPATAKARQKAIDQMETAMLDAKIYSLLLGSIINASGLDRITEDSEAGYHRLSDDDSEQIVFVALKLENATIQADKAFHEVFSSGGEVAA